MLWLVTAFMLVLFYPILLSVQLGKGSWSPGLFALLIVCPHFVLSCLFFFLLFLYVPEFSACQRRANAFDCGIHWRSFHYFLTLLLKKQMTLLVDEQLTLLKKTNKCHHFLRIVLQERWGLRNRSLHSFWRKGDTTFEQMTFLLKEQRTIRLKEQMTPLLRKQRTILLKEQLTFLLKEQRTITL